MLFLTQEDKKKFDPFNHLFPHNVKDVKEMLVYRNLLINDEGLKLIPYDDETSKPAILASGGNITIGIGTNLSCIEVDEAIMLMNYRLYQLEKNLLADFTFYKKLDIVRQFVLLNMGYNMGLNALYGFSDMIAACSKSKWNLASEEILDSDAARKLKARYTRLAYMMKTGKLFEKNLNDIHSPSK